MHLSRLVLLGTLIAVASAMPAKAGAVKKSTSKKSVQQKTKSVQIYTTHSGITTTRALSTLAVSIGTPPASHKPTSTSTEKAQHTTTRVSSTSSTSKGTPPASRKSTSTSTKKAQQTTIRVSSTSSTSKGTPPASHKSTSTSTKKAQQTSTRVSSTSSTSKGTPSATNTPTSNSLNYQNIDSSATSGARALLKYLQSQFGSHILSGQQDAGSLKWVQQNVGKTPAIQGNDFMDYSPSRVAYGAKSTAVEDAIAFDKEGGINAFVWHWNAPTSLYNTAAEPWYSGFYTAATSFNIQAALAQGSGGSDYKLILRDIDAIAVEIKRLSDAGIPILFRPLHEPDGGWFWWGAHGSAPFLQLWGILYDRITNYHGLHNIVWVCNTFVPSWYPGNSKCDIATTDVYPAAGDHNPQVSAWNSLHQVTSGQRILALAEVGVVPDPSSCMSQHVPWAYWVVWSGSFISGGSDNSMQFLKTLYSSSSIVTVDSTTRLGSWKSA